MEVVSLFENIQNCNVCYAYEYNIRKKKKYFSNLFISVCSMLYAIYNNNFENISK